MRKIILLLALTGAAQGAGLITESPFISAATPAAQTASSTGPIEFHGTMEMPDGIYFSIYDTAKKHSTLVKVGDPSNPFVVRSYHANTEQIVVEYQGASQTLALKHAKILNLGGPAAAIPPGAAGVAAVAPAVAATPMPNLPPGASIEEWAAEVQRRRELRTPTDATAPATTAPATPAAPPPRG